MYGLTLGRATPATVNPSSPTQGIRELLARRGLPDAQFERLWGGHGTHCCCEACGRTISGDEVEYELEFRQGAQRLTVVLHRDCWEEWRMV
jgi:hypothetical protein